MWPLSYDTYFDINSGLFSKIDKKLHFFLLASKRKLYTCRWGIIWDKIWIYMYTFFNMRYSSNGMKKKWSNSKILVNLFIQTITNQHLNF